ncbi:MAG: TIGR03790 family protein [Phycisphaerae bacterium]|nr:TIGR03790 family protein [Phycisphaerae bacterium]
MRRYLPVLLGSVVLASAAGGASALAPELVVIVANANVPESMAVAAYYATHRQIDPSQIVALQTTGGYLVSREDYESQIVQPLRAALRQRGLAERTRCLALMWGVPVRVAAPEDVTGELFVAEATKAHYRLAVDYKLLSTVGRTFPPPRTSGLEPLAELFESPTPSVPEPLPEWSVLLKDVETMFDLKYRDLAAMEAGPKKQIAARQLMALHLDIRGREGLIQFLLQADLAHTALVERLQRELDAARDRLRQLRAEPTSLDAAKAILAALQEIGGVAAVGAHCLEQKPSTSVLRAADAAVDSELALLWADDYPTDRQLANPLSWRYRRANWAGKTDPPAVLRTARIDGPTHGDALRIIRESVEAEQVGLAGKFYIDAGGPDRAKEYDESLRQLYRMVQATTKLHVVLDDSVALFPPGSCPDAALYVGWYSLQKYVPAFQWVPGSVGWHVASFEAMHLRDPSSQEWCPQMIRGGVAATLGAVDEPTLGGMPMPQDFFALLLTGRYTVAECYWRTEPVVSWRVTLIADPLYNPFKVNPQLGVQLLPPDLVPPGDWPPAYTGPPTTSASAPATTTSAPGL